MTDLVSAWSCDQKKRDHNTCRDPHGCHCREITAQRAAIETLTREKSALKARVNALTDEVINYDVELDQSEARAEAAEKLVADAAEVIRPFAERMDTLTGISQRACATTVETDWLRAARAWTDKHDKGEK